MVTVDLVDVTESAVNAAFARAEPKTTVRLHGDCQAWNSVHAKKKTGLILDLSDAHLTEVLLPRRQFGQPIVRFQGCTDSYVVGGTITGSNTSNEDGVDARRENYPGVAIGGGSTDCGVDGTHIEKTWGDFVMVGARRLLPTIKHNERISIRNVTGQGAGRHGFSVRDCVGYTLTGTTTKGINRLWFDHEPAKLEHFTDAQIAHNEGPQGGQNLWFQLIPRLTSECGNITVTDHRLTRGNFKVRATASKFREYSGLHFARLERTPENPTALATKPFDIRPGWVDVTIEP